MVEAARPGRGEGTMAGVRRRSPWPHVGWGRGEEVTVGGGRWAAGGGRRAVGGGGHGGDDEVEGEGKGGVAVSRAEQGEEAAGEATPEAGKMRGRRQGWGGLRRKKADRVGEVFSACACVAASFSILYHLSNL